MLKNWKGVHTLQVVLGIAVGVCGVIGQNIPQDASIATACVGALTLVLTALGVTSPSAVRGEP